MEREDLDEGVLQGGQPVPQHVQQQVKPAPQPVHVPYGGVGEGKQIQGLPQQPISVPAAPGVQGGALAGVLQGEAQQVHHQRCQQPGYGALGNPSQDIEIGEQEDSDGGLEEFLPRLRALRGEPLRGGASQLELPANSLGAQALCLSRPLLEEDSPTYTPAKKAKMIRTKGEAQGDGQDVKQEADPDRTMQEALATALSSPAVRSAMTEASQLELPANSLGAQALCLSRPLLEEDSPTHTPTKKANMIRT